MAVHRTVPNLCLSAQIRKSILGCDEINGTFYWCRSCLWHCGIVMKKNVKECWGGGTLKCPWQVSARCWMGNKSIMAKAHSKQEMINVSLDVFAHMLADRVCAACTHKHQDICIQIYSYEHAMSYVVTQASTHLSHIYSHTNCSYVLNLYAKYFACSVFSSKLLNWTWKFKSAHPRDKSV